MLCANPRQNFLALATFPSLATVGQKMNFFSRPFLPFPNLFLIEFLIFGLRLPIAISLKPGTVLTRRKGRVS